MFHGHLATAQDDAEKASRNFATSQPEWAWKFRLLEADVLLRRGLSENVLSLIGPELPPSLANGDLAVKRFALMGLADIRLGNLHEADSNLRQGQKMCTLPTSAVAGELATALGVLEMNGGHLQQADSYFRQSLDVARQQHDDFLAAAALLNLAVTAVQKEHYDESIDWLNSAHKSAQTLGYALVEEKALGSLGWAYYKMGDFEKSLSLFTEATDKARALGAMFDQVKWLNILGVIEYQRGQFPAAEEHYRKAFALAQTIKNKKETTDALLTLAFVVARTGRLQLAKQYSDQAIRLAQEEQDRAAELYLVLLNGELAQRAGDSTRAQKAFLEVSGDANAETSLRWQAAGDLARLYEDERHPDTADKYYRSALRTFESARSSFYKEESRLPFMANASELYGDYVHCLLEQGKVAEALQVADYGRSQTLAEGLGLLQKTTGFSPIAFDAQQIARKTGSTILFYMLGREQSYLWAATPDKLALFRLPSETEIDDAVDRYRKALIGPRDVLESDNPEGSKLYEILVAPAANLIPPNGHVIIVSDGSLNNLNFETLLVRQPKLHYWIDDVSVVNAASIKLIAAAHSDWRNKATHRLATDRLLLIGNPISPNSDYGNLPGADIEMQKIADHFAASGRQVFAREQATAPAYLGSNPEQFSYIHFVAHGTASRLSPLDSAVVLSKATTQDDSFKLYARDIINRPLKAELVTVSSCYGSGVRAYSGEGLVGLSWAFLRAGAHNVIGALWEVSDDSTPYLMDNLYASLAKSQRPSDALRSAKLALLHSKGVFRKPFYWAPFQFYIGS